VQHQTKSPIPGYGTTRRLLKAYALFDVLCGRALGTEKTNFAGGKEAGRLLGIRAYSIHPTFLRRRLRKDLGFCTDLSQPSGQTIVCSTETLPDCAPLSCKRWKFDSPIHDANSSLSIC
jgi:hypothetical protein